MNKFPQEKRSWILNFNDQSAKKVNVEFDCATHLMGQQTPRYKIHTNTTIILIINVKMNVK